MDILKGLHNEGRTVILITHDNDIAAQAKRVIKIKDGKGNPIPDRSFRWRTADSRSVVENKSFTCNAMPPVTVNKL